MRICRSLVALAAWGAACVEASPPIVQRDGGIDAGTSGAGDARADSAPAPTTCASGDFWTDGTRGDELMTPGRPCRACHLRLAPELAYFFAGTVFGARHEKDDCNSPPPPDARVEILDGDGNVLRVLFPNAAGNFQSSTVIADVPLPYYARVVAGGEARAMVAAQRDGDCNGCHTEQGAMEAPGRIVWPGSGD